MSCGLQGALGMPMSGSPGNGGVSKDNYFSNTGVINKLDKEKDINATSSGHMITGQRANQGAETYIEIKGPSGVGQRSKTPYSGVLPKYKKAAEQAMTTQQIPKSHQKRVREYFESLAGGGK